MALLDDVKVSLRITTTSFDSEITGLINAAQLDLGIAGVELPTDLDDICNVAITTYCKMMFGSPDEYDRLKASYDEQKAQLATRTGYTDWGDE